MDPKNINLDLIPKEIREFIESILQDAQMSNLDKQMYKEMVKELYIRLDNFMLTTIVEALPPEKLEEFAKMAEAGKERDELEDYLKANIENADEVFAKAMLEFRDLYLGNVNAERSGVGTN